MNLKAIRSLPENNKGIKQLESLLDILNFSSRLLEEKGINDARLNAELLMCKVLNCSRLNLYLNFDKPLSKVERDEYKSFLKKRIMYEPLQYIVGETEFYGYKFTVNPSVLIPRPDTEILVELVLKDILTAGKDKVNIFEIGTGSGCITVALYLELIKAGIDPRILSIDNSSAALKVAEKNLIDNGIEIENSKIVFKNENFLNMELFEENFDYVVTNPPYISAGDIQHLDNEVKDNEPRNALTDGADGLSFYNKLFDLMNKTPGAGQKLFTEIEYNKKAVLTGMLDNRHLNSYKFHKDYSRNFRVLEVTK